ncbi:hypothetical protein DYP11_24670 [Escherichia coli]|nr:hypothetical protein [Escherichia coli]
MNGFRNSSRNGLVWRYQRAGGPLFWRSVDAGWKRQKHGDGLPVLRPGQTGSSLPEKGLNTATGAAGEGCNEKSSLHYSRSQKAERSL